MFFDSSMTAQIRFWIADSDSAASLATNSWRGCPAAQLFRARNLSFCRWQLLGANRSTVERVLEKHWPHLAAVNHWVVSSIPGRGGKLPYRAKTGLRVPTRERPNQNQA